MSPQYPERFVNLQEARRRFGDRTDRLGKYLWKVDTLADDVVSAMREMPRGEGFRMFERALKDGIDTVPDAPKEIRRFFEEAEKVPVFVDWDRINRGGELLFRGGPFSGVVLGLKSLVFGYCSPGGNKPLVMSGRLTERASRRINETARFVYDVCLPHGLERGNPGYCTALKVRLMHAQVRRLILDSGDWDTDRYGAPINLHDMLATSLLFSVVLVRGLMMLGFALTYQERQRYMELWRYVGWLSGVPVELLPITYEDGHNLGELIYVTQGEPDDDSRALVKAFMQAPIHAARNERQRQAAQRRLPLSYGICRGLMGDEIADQLRLPDDRWRYAVPVLSSAIRQAERVRRMVPRGRDLAIFTGTRHWEGVLKAVSRGETFTYAPPESLAGRLLAVG